jgi:hypothetical protein
MTLAPHRQQILLVIGGYLIATLGGAAIVERILQWLKETPSATTGSTQEDAPAGGKIIGMLERALIYGGMLVGHPEVVALVIAIKSVARFPEFKAPRFAEYFLVGNFLSLICSLAISYLIIASLAAHPLN